jgi:DNA-binding transcriptional regulator YiaG
MASTENLYHYTQCGLNNIYLQNGYDLKKTPYGSGVAIHDVDGLHRAIAIALVDKPAPLTGKEFRFIRIELDLSQRALGEYLGKTDQSVAHWEKTGNIPEEVNYLIRHIYRQTINKKASYVDEVDRLRKVNQTDYKEWLNFQETSGSWEKTAA